MPPRSLQTAALGMQTQQTSIDNIANNLSNANTTGYKRSRVVFQDLLYENVQASAEGQTDGAEPAELQIGSGTTAVATVRNFSQGSFSKTGNSLDLAINGDGFFQVQQPDGSLAYTRDGTFTLSSEGNIVTQTGLKVQPNINVPPNAVEISIDQEGTVKARLQGESEMVELGQMELARFPNSAGLRPQGGNLYEQTESSGEPFIGTPGRGGLGNVRQGFLEKGNVKVVQEMTSLIQAQRTYELNSRMVTTSDEMMQTANNVKR
ncbi:flagellar basal-body rod protein FlgG [Salinibacter ruber]|uniref:flagellar basal-body rod protein FlgG n=1 Tax=Salinibacter ruber TaxID=146919 RepID=UPI002168EF6B|nr:flagellar basal-body rod protein FlgG [Salinibacter ruber]MCS3642477.1 flagellar basal-body rod protein FlgG [Salinibacter ruber]